MTDLVWRKAAVLVWRKLSEPRRARGFTLIEMMIVIAILGLLVSFMVPGSRRGERLLVLAKEQAFLTGVVNRARNLAVQKIQRGADLICGWGVYVDVSQNRYAIFADVMRGADQDCDQSDKRYSQNEATEWFMLDPRVTFLPIEPSGVTDVLFVAPEQFVYFNGCSPSPDNPPHGVGGCPFNPAPATIFLTLAAADGTERIVSINKAGQVYAHQP